MKHNATFLPLLLFSACCLFFSACSKDGLEDEKPIETQGMSMKVNGQLWTSAMTTLFTEEMETSEYGKFHIVSLLGTRIIESNSPSQEDKSESFSIFISIPESKLRNPKGTYPVILKESKPNHAWAIFASSQDLREVNTYVSSSSEAAAGTIEITGFEYGPQTVFGQNIGKDGYTKLTGKFLLNVYPLNAQGSPLEITEGSFSFNGGIGFSF